MLFYLFKNQTCFLRYSQKKSGPKAAFGILNKILKSFDVFKNSKNQFFIKRGLPLLINIVSLD